MRLLFWRGERGAAAPSGECSHLWSNWSEPGACRVIVYAPWIVESTQRDGWAQDRHCLQCNIYERRTA